MGIGRNCVIDRAIIDKNARIADGVVITPEGKPDNFDAENYYIRDGIVVIPKNAVASPGQDAIGRTAQNGRATKLLRGYFGFVA
jgi:ADP-glucose pyrophosphorylase